MKGDLEFNNCDEYDRLLERGVDDKKACRKQILAAFLASLMSFSSGTVVAGWTKTTSYKNDDGLTIITQTETSWIVSSYVLGALIGALPAGRLSHKYGPKRLLLWLAVPMTVGWLLPLVDINNVLFICIGRFTCGLSLGATTVVLPLYAGAVSSDTLRGRTGVFLDFMMCAGILFAYVTRSWLPGFREFHIVCSLIPIAFAAVFNWMPESPSYLYFVGKYEKASRAMRWLRGRSFNIREEFNRLDRSQWTNKSISKTRIDKKVMHKAVIISFGLVLAQRLSGAGGVIQYTVNLFEMTGALIDPNTASIIVGVFQLVASWVSILLIDRTGRRTLLLISSSVITVCLAMLTCYFYLLHRGDLADSPWKYASLVIVCVFISGFRLGLGPIPWFMVTELISSKDSGRVQSVMASFSWFLSFLIMKTFKFLIQQNATALWLSCTVYSAAGLAFILFYVPETNNKSREQIQAELSID
ncbi:facilitated trehalose transporter Tret1-like [Adelges cooleyi]|uniref:facilitated trehalose transporter Tret1-like n=1 Tax=Adelges cooleyi TaxID=133065 RepID=UPI0021800036|nr:facilitated trehalose transporter Tret1-like [Adelges cooleyi]XP_050422960.1 facilitated trehalose transporter Tret1-like [Adelges cooleyi]